MRTGHLTGWSRSHRTRIHLAPEPDGRVPRQISARTSASSSVRKHRQALQLYQMHGRAPQFNARIHGALGAPVRGVLPLHVLTQQGGRNAATGCCEPPGVHRLPRRVRSIECSAAHGPAGSRRARGCSRGSSSGPLPVPSNHSSATGTWSCTMSDTRGTMIWTFGKRRSCRDGMTSPCVETSLTID